MIYVDPTIPCVPNVNWPYNRVSHMFTHVGNLDGLHAAAKALGLKREWFQWKRLSLPHYDLTPHKRAMAIRFGAEEVTGRFMVDTLNSWREEPWNP